MPPTSKPPTDNIDFSVVESFMTRARQASRLGSKEIKVPMPEGYELASAIGQLLARNLKLVEQLKILQDLTNMEFKVDGGSYQ